MDISPLVIILPSWQGAFSCIVAFAESGFAFTPTRDEVLIGLTDMVEQLVDMAGDLPRPLTSKALVTRFLKKGEGILDVQSVSGHPMVGEWAPFSQ